MTRCLHKLRSVPILLALLVLPGFVIRAVVPPGFMPVASRNAPLTMALCPGHAVQPDTPVPAGGPTPGNHGQPDKGKHEAPCIYAATAGGGPAAFIPAAVIVPASQDVLVLPPIVAPAARQLPRAHPPRAPPAFS